MPGVPVVYAYFTLLSWWAPPLVAVGKVDRLSETQARMDRTMRDAVIVSRFHQKNSLECLTIYRAYKIKASSLFVTRLCYLRYESLMMY